MSDTACPAPPSASAPSHLLLVEDDEGLLELFRQQLANCGLTLHSKTSARAALEWLAARPDCLMLLDYSLPDMTAKGLIAAAAQQGGVPPFIVITGHGDERIAVEMMKLGARDYVVKDATLLDRLLAVVERALREIENQRRLAASERKFQAIFEGSDDALLLLDQRGFLDCNGCALSLFDLDHKSQLRELHLADLSPGVQPDGRDSRSAANEWVASALQGLTRRFEWVCRRRDGREFPTEVLLSPFELDGHTVLLATVRDITERRRIEEVQAFLAQTSSGTTTEPFFNKLARYLAQSLEMDYVCIDRLEGDGLTARTVAVWCDSGFKENVTYALKDTPCGEVVGKAVCCYPASVRHFFPQDQVLRDLRAESYVGVTLCSHAGPPIGLIAVIGRKPLMNRAVAVATLNLVAVRAAGELERQQAEEHLRESEIQFRAMFETASIGIAQADPQTGQWLRVNSKMCAITGYAAEELLHARVSDITHPEDRQRDWDAFQRLVSGEAPSCQLEKRCVRKDGAVTWVNVNMTVLRDAAGQPTRTMAAIEEITERKWAECVMARFAQLGRDLSSATEAQQAARIIVDAAQELVGGDSAFLVLRSADLQRLDHILHWDTIDGKWLEVPPITDGDEPTPIERRIQADGALIILREPDETPAIPTRPFGDTTRRSESLLYVPVRYQNRYLGIFSIQSYRSHAYSRANLELLQALADHCAGALGRIRIEESRREGEMRHRLLVEHLNSGVVVHAPDTTILYANPAASRLLGLTQDELFGRQATDPAWHLLREDGSRLPVEEYPVSRVLSTRRPFTDQLVGVNRPGAADRTWTLVSGYPVFREDQGLEQVVISFVDITERKRAEESSLAASRRMQAAVKAGNIGLWEWDLASNRVHYSAEWKRQIGYEEQEIGEELEEWRTRVHPEDLAATLVRVQEAIAGCQQHYGVEFRFRHKDGSYRWILTRASVYPDAAGKPVRVLGSHLDITERKRDEAILQARLRLAEFSATHSLEELLVATLDEAEILTGSRVGFYHFLEPDQKTLSLQAWSTRTSGEMCHAEGKGRHYNVADAGVWVDCIHQRRPVIHNDYASLAHRKGLPDGHAAVVRELVVPVFRGEKIVAILGMGNKPADYAEDDVAAVSRLADLAWEIAERKRAQAAREESEQRFRAIIEDSQAGYFRLDRQGCYVSVNRAWLGMHGYTTPEEVVGQPFSFTQTEEGLPAVQSILDRLLAGEPVPVAELTRRCKNGSVGTHTFSAHPIREGSAIAGLEGFLIDTTSLKRAEADYAMLFEKMLDGFALHEMIFNAAGQPCDYRFLAVNPGFEHMTGLPAKSVLGKTIREVTPGIEPFWIETYGRVATTGEPELFEHFSAELNRHFEVSAFRPAPGRFACVIVDITERKLAEAEALRYQAQLEAIYDNAPLMMCLVNERREVERMNRAMATLSGRTLADADARRHGDILGCLNALDDPAGCGAGPHCLNCTLRTAVADTFKTGLPQSGVETSHFLASPGGRREVRLSASTALVRIAAETKLLLCLEDVTVRKQLEQQFLQAQKMEAVGQLAGGVAHDFNNILAAIIMHLHLLQEGTGLDVTMAGALKEVQSYAQRAAELTRQLLLFSRRKTAQTKRLDVNELLEGMLKMLRRVLGEHIETKLETARDGQWVDADPGMLEQIVMNLCVNARDAMPQGGRLTLATATVEFPEGHSHSHPDGRAGRFVCLSVQDAGCGMDESTLKRIFEPFFTTKEVGKGTGLGLATVYGIARQHQGWVQAESAVGLGTTFRVYLPRTAAPETSFTDKDITVMPRGSETILLVEDEPGLLKLAATILRRCGYRVLEARNGVEALSVWQETGGEAELLFTDVVMPGGVGGLELMERLHAIKPGLKVILSSGYSLELARRKVGQHEQARLLAKPYDPVTLAKTVREVLDKH